MKIESAKGSKGTSAQQHSQQQQQRRAARLQRTVKVQQSLTTPLTGIDLQAPTIVQDMPGTVTYNHFQQ
uniref:Activating transcription factor 7-interacting protein 1 n=1 Tax=Steinernema glaseri TaxID=37863 RepID=A0A1I7Y0T0_9BILA